ncbi:M56 family metallopeptidase [Kaistella sp.]|uniref:M56 family metallopeptidase n=2 Tax=Kaistella sp. TaxID=2782235 RepID=UPI002F91CE02
MQLFFLYLAKVILTSGVMFCYYRLFLKDRTFHHYNRFYLLAVLVISLLLPLLKVDYFTVEVNSSIYLLLNKLNNINESKNLSHDHFYYQFTALGFGVAALFFLTRLFYGILKIELLKRRYTREIIGDINFYQTALHEAPFSFFRNLFWKNSIPLHSDLGKQILKHEMVHIEQKHSWDKIFIEILTSIFWFNPFFYLIKKEIILIHEYLADKKAIKNSDTRAFAQMLLASQFSGNHLPAASPFLSSNLKKRITMLTKSKTKFSYARRLFALPILFIIAFAYLVNAKNREIKETNLEIEKYITAVQTDTLTTKPDAPDAPVAPLGPEVPPAVEKEIKLKTEELKPLNDALMKNNEEAKKISKEMSLTGKKLEKLAKKNDFDSPKFKKLEKEMSQLSGKMDQLFNSEDFKINMKKLELKQVEMDKLYAQLDFYNSDDFKLKIKEFENQAKEADRLYNSPEFRKKIQEAERKALEMEKKVNSPEFKKQIEEAEKRAREVEKQINSPEFQLRIKEAEKAAAEAAKRKNSADIVFQNEKKEMNIYVDGKLVTQEEMNTISTNRIERMNIYKKVYNGSKANEIHITTKK